MKVEFLLNCIFKEDYFFMKCIFFATEKSEIFTNNSIEILV